MQGFKQPWMTPYTLLVGREIRMFLSERMWGGVAAMLGPTWAGRLEVCVCHAGLHDAIRDCALATRSTPCCNAGLIGLFRILQAIVEMTPVGFELTPLRTGALSQRLRPLGQSVLRGFVEEDKYTFNYAANYKLLGHLGEVLGPPLRTGFIILLNMASEKFLFCTTRKQDGAPMCRICLYS